MYKLTRQEVADKLNISTRSVDRYIKAGKLRAKKEGKVVYVKKSDVENFIVGGVAKQEVIIEKKGEENNINTKEILIKSESNSLGNLGRIYKDLKEEIGKKDILIQNLAMRVGKAEEVAKNSVSLLDFKKSQYLLEESKGNLKEDIVDLEKERTKLESELKYEKKSNVILIVFVVLLLIIAGTVWFIQI